MFRVLPYLIICLTGLVLSRLGGVLINDGSEAQNHKHLALARSSDAAKAEKKIDPITADADNKPLFTDQTCEFSPSEVKLLKALSQRRKSLAEREKALDFKETSVKVLQSSVQKKLKKLTNLQTELVELLKEYNQKQNEKTARLVRVYENMRPKEAAKIFEELGIPVLLDVAEHMREVKLAPILAAMQPQKAKELTVALAKRRQLSQ